MHMGPREDGANESTIDRLVRDVAALHAEIYGNGKNGMKDDIRAVSAQLKMNTALTIGVLGAIGAAVGAAIARGVF